MPSNIDSSAAVGSGATATGLAGAGDLVASAATGAVVTALLSETSEAGAADDDGSLAALEGTSGSETAGETGAVTADAVVPVDGFTAGFAEGFVEESDLGPADESDAKLADGLLEEE